MITSEQIRAARALIRMSAEELADASGVGYSTIRRMEAADGVPPASARNLAAIKIALEAKGIRFTAYGVELRPLSPAPEDDEGPSFSGPPL